MKRKIKKINHKKSYIYKYGIISNIISIYLFEIKKIHIIIYLLNKKKPNYINISF